MAARFKLSGKLPHYREDNRRHTGSFNLFLTLLLTVLLTVWPEFLSQVNTAADYKVRD